MTGIYGQDWSAYSPGQPGTAGLAFAFVKATEGVGWINPLYTEQKAHAEAAGLITGSYHYPHMANSAVAEAEYFLAHADTSPGQFLWLDWEGNGQGEASYGLSNAELESFKNNFLAYVKARFPLTVVGVYCDKDFWLNIDTTSYCQDALWIATAGLPAGEPGISYPYLIHQYGTGSGVDLDFCPLPDKATLAQWVVNTIGGTVSTPAEIATATVNLMNTDRDTLAFAGLYWLRLGLDPATVFTPSQLALPVGQQASLLQVLVLDQIDTISALTDKVDALAAAVAAAGTLSDAQAQLAGTAGATAALAILGKDLEGPAS